jgi:coenzyme F420-reducing hydrogenase beta subunit/polysaccharide pyruvyl transferase WcaK-like protein
MSAFGGAFAVDLAGRAATLRALRLGGRFGMRNWSNEEIQRYLGEEHGCWLTHSADEEVRDGAASGGTTSQLLINLLEKKLVDGVLVWRMKCGEAEPMAEPIIAKTREEVLSARGSKYTSVSYPRQALPLIKAFDGRLAVVTVPCDASYLRRKIKADPKLGEKIACIVTLFCGHNSEPELTKLIVRKHGMQWNEVEDFKYRTGLWRGRLTFRSKDGREVDIPTRTFTHYQNLHLFSERKCLNCTDHYGYDSDISTGDIWSLDQKKEDVKPTLMVAKTERGREFIDKATDNIEMKAVHPRVVVNGNSRGMTYHYHISARAKAGKLFGIKIKDPMKLPVTPLDRLVATVGVFNYWISHQPRFRPLIEKIPYQAIVGYIYFFKGLQQVNLFLYRPFPPTDKVSIIGATLTGNRGAEAMLVTSIGKVRDQLPNARFVIHSYFPNEDREICKDLGVEVVDASPVALVTQYFPFAVADRVLNTVGLSFPRSWMPAGPRELKESRALLDVFGVSYNDGREKFLPFNVLSNWPAMMMGTPVVKLSQGLGKYENRLTRTIGKWMLRKCERVFARGQESMKMAEDVGIGEPLDHAPDIAFVFEERYALTEENPDYAKQVAGDLQRRRGDGQRVLVLSLSSVVKKKCDKSGIDYEGSMAKIVDHFLDQGHAVVLLPNANREGKATLHNNDIPVVEAVAGLVHSQAADANLIRLNRGLNAAGLRVVMRQADFLVASRFHAMIAGLALGLPTLVLGWSHKYREILAMFGLQEWAYDFTELDVAKLTKRIEELIAQEKGIRSKISDNIDRVKAAAQHQFDWLADFLRVQANVCTDDDDELDPSSGREDHAA